MSPQRAALRSQAVAPKPKVNQKQAVLLATLVGAAGGMGAGVVLLLGELLLRSHGR